jgi:hypothetical protein
VPVDYRVIAFEPSSQRQTSDALPVTSASFDFWGMPPVPRGLRVPPARLLATPHQE